MNINKTNLINKICAILAIFALTVSDFLLVGKTGISYAIDAVKTNHANVEYEAYFENEKGEKLEKIEDNIDKEEYLYVDVTVKNEGYFNGEISLENNNFNIKEDKLSEEVEEIKDNKVKLKQINAGSTSTIKLAIEAKKDNKIKEESLSSKTEVNLGGSYVNSKNVEKEKYIEIKGKAEVEVKWTSKEDTKVELEGKLLTNSVYEVNGENKRLVQMVIGSKVTDNNYPVKNTEISLNVPEKVKEVKVTARSVKGTNSGLEFGEGNYEYQKEENKLTIKVGNEDKENVSWEKGVEDTFVVTYVLNPNENIANEDIKIKDKIKLYDEKEIEEEKDVHIEEEIDGVISSTIESSEDEIYKGKIYTGEERSYTETNKINVDYIEAGDKIEIEQKAGKYVAGEEEKEANIIYRETRINKEEMKKILGEEGSIIVKDQNGEMVAEINKDSKTNEEGKVVITYPEDEKEIKLETSKPENIGTLNIENTKVIKDAGYGRDEIKNITKIREKTTVNTKVAEKEINLKETETEGKIDIDTNKISTVAENQTITVNATLEANDESKNLYKNPTVTVKLPKEMTLKTAQYAALYKNGLEVEDVRSSKNENGENEINIKLKGEQEKYDVTGGTKICLKLDVATNKLTPSKKSQIDMTYTNENGSEVKTTSADINFESQYGIMIYNQIVNYNNNGDTLVTVDKETAYGELSTNADQRDITLSTALINNYGEDVTNVTLIGKIPAENNEESYVAKLNQLQTNNEKVKVYYSNKQNIEAGDESWGEYSDNATSYKVVVEQMDKEEVIKLNVPVTIPGKLKYNKKGTFASVVTCDNNGNSESNTSNIVLATKTSMSANSEEKVTTKQTEKGFNTKISAQVGNDSLSDNDNIYEGQTIRYKVTVTNNTGKDYSNVTVKANQKNGYMWNSVEEDVVNPYYGTSLKEHFYEVSNSNEIVLDTIPSLKDGESKTYEYEASIYQLNNEKIDGTETFGTISAVSEDKTLNETVTTIKNNIKNAELQVSLVNGSSDEALLTSGGTVKTSIEIKNLTNEVQKDVDVKVAFSSNLKPDVNILEENESNVTYKGVETSKDGTKTMTLKVNSINAGDTIKIEMLPSTNYTLDGEKEANVWMLAEAISSNQNSYISNKLTRTVRNYSADLELDQQGEFEDGKAIDVKTDKLNDGEKIQITATIINHEDKEHKLDLEYNMDKMLDVESAKIKTASGEEDILNEVSYNSLVKKDQTINPGETIKINVVGTVDALNTESITNNLNVFDQENGRTEDNNLTISVNKTEDPVDVPEDNNQDDNNGDNNNSGDNNNNSSEDNNSQDDDIKYTISGTAWLDADKDGRRASQEELKGDIDVIAINAETGDVVTTSKTASDGTYKLEVSKGKYIVVFKYDTNLYSTTTYQVKGSNDTENSDAISREVTVNGEKITAGTTDTLTVDKNISNIDIGLILRSTFDLKLQKYVSKITVKNDSKTTNYDQKENTTLAKAEIKSKNLNGSLVVIEYKIKVTNTGDVAGYARNIVDYMPSTLNFNSSLNSDWYISGNNVYNTSLANTKIEPGESKELTLVLTKTMTDSNTGLVNNKAEITESSNELGIKDETNDKGSADVIISVSTGALVNYVATTVITLIVLAGLAYIVNKKFLSKKI